MGESYLCITGRLQDLSVAELEAVFGAKIKPISKQAVIVPTKISQSDYDRLGGSLKAAKLSASLPNDWSAIESHLKANISELVPENGKIQLGLSTYGIPVSSVRLQKTLLNLKKQLKEKGRSVRVIFGKANALSTAEVYHNKLTGDQGCEIIITGSNDTAYLAITSYVQDINSYVRRDRNRPMRDTRVGMLPPKLAQTIVNLAVADTESKGTVLDPFCGTGVVLQEATLMGFGVYGTDLEPRMIEYSAKNLDWIFNTTKPWQLEVGDATKISWKTFDFVAGETYLGPPLTKYVPDTEIRKIINSVNILHEKFLVNLAKQAKSGTRICLGVPAWRRPSGYLHLPVLEKLGQFGYNWVEFEHVDSKNLIYDRDDQFVARQLIVITKK